MPDMIYFCSDFASVNTEIDVRSSDFASVSADIDIPSGVVACQEENNTRKRYLYVLDMK